MLRQILRYDQVAMNQPNNPLHGKTLKIIVTELHNRFGWVELAKLVPVRCFNYDPSLKSSLAFLRKTPWARDKVEALYLEMLQADEKGVELKRADKTRPYVKRVDSRPVDKKRADEKHVDDKRVEEKRADEKHPDPWASWREKE
jgi:uncharacterized protein (DUF2132 family)